MKKLKTFAAALILIAFPLVARAGEPFGEMTPQEVVSYLKTKNFYVYDNNDPERYKMGHLPGAKWLNPMDYDAKQLPADKNATLVFYCASPH